MNTEIAMRTTGFLLGAFLSAIFVGYLLLSFAEGQKRGRRRISGSRKFAGGFSLAFGLVMLCAWTYLLLSGWSSFRAQLGRLWLHVSMELAPAVALIVGGVAMLRGWSRGPVLFVTANGLLIASTFLALSEFGNAGHPLLMIGGAVLLTLASVYVVGLVYSWQHFVLKLDQPGSDESSIRNPPRTPLPEPASPGLKRTPPGATPGQTPRKSG